MTMDVGCKQESPSGQPRGASLATGVHGGNGDGGKPLES